VAGELVSDIKSYRDLEVWQRSKDLALEFYRVTRSFPGDEKFGLTSQIRRASVSVAANIAEGQARVHTGDFVRHLSMARGSLAEVETLLEIATGLDYLQREKVKQLWNELQTVGRMLTALIQSLEAHSRKKLSSKGANQPPITSHQPPTQERADKAL
jgi:four helix bundle protein